MMPLVAVFAGVALLYFWITGRWFAGLLVWFVACYFATPIFIEPGGHAPFLAWAALLIPALYPFAIRHAILEDRRTGQSIRGHIRQHLRQLP